MTNDYTKISLSNNLRILTLPMKGVDSVTVTIWVGAGSRYEEKEMIGLAHFSEHMFFKGTKRRPRAIDISQEIDGIGGEFNAGTSKDYTVFYVKCGAKHFSLALDVLSDMLTESKFDPEEIEREKGVIVEEINMRDDNPREIVDDLLFEVIFPGHPLSFFTGGLKDTVLKFKREDFQRYLASLYAPSNMVLCVAGSVDEREVKKLAQEKLGGVRDFKAKKFLPARGKTGDQVKVFNKKTEQAHLALGVVGYPLRHKMRYAQAVLDVILGRGMSSRLFINIRERLGLAYYIGSQEVSFQDTGVQLVLAGVDLQKIDKALSAIVSELEKLVAKDVPDKELKKAKEYLKGRLALDLEDSRGQAFYHGYQEVMLKKVESPKDWIKKIEKVTKEEVCYIASELFAKQKLRMAVIGPYDDSSRFAKILNR